MKNKIIIATLILITIFFSFKFGAWYGHAVATAEAQMKEPDPIDEIESGSKAEMYSNYMLKNCLMEKVVSKANEHTTN